jgi:OFA family oxalate/formate antiporter-like MFS transporter
MSSSAGSQLTSTKDPTRGRWWIVIAALLLQFSIGAVYAWSVFSTALKDPDAMGLSNSQASLPFTVTIGMIFIGSYLGGRIQDRTGPRPVALTGGLIYAVGCIIASFAREPGQLWLLVVGYGVISGFGLGFAYIVPIAMLQKWFPDKRGLITGLAVAGFGFGAVATAPVAKWLIGMDPTEPNWAFLPLGIAYLVLSVIGASFFRNPPDGYEVPGWVPSTTGPTRDSAKQYTEKEALRTPQWYLLAAILTLNVTVGIALIAQANSTAIDVAGYSAAGAATVVGLFALFNGGGRIFWAWVSGFTGRM